MENKSQVTLSLSEYHSLYDKAKGLHDVIENRKYVMVREHPHSMGQDVFYYYFEESEVIERLARELKESQELYSKMLDEWRKMRDSYWELEKTTKKDKKETFWGF